MGVVYRARDPRVGREVAIKMSSGQFSDRFGREARAVAALNHPNICTLYDVGPNFLVMELVDGEPPKGPLPVATVVAYARQIADALDAAHEKGIIHRDLKPSNIRVRSDGTVKILDFGLAKIASGEEQPDDSSEPPTMSVSATRAGTILGTAAYMAPEQARGKPVDKRADIWAFGAVLYELSTGRRAFDGEDISSVLAAVLQSEPSWDGVPSSLRPLLESCLEKDPRKRLRDIGDAARMLGSGTRQPAPAARGSRAGWITAAVLAAVAVAALWLPRRTAPTDAAQPVVRLDVDLGPNVSLTPLVAPTFSSVIISPDGSRLAFVGTISGASSRLFTRRFDDPQVTELSGTEGASQPFFSPDGQWLAFWRLGKLAKVPIEGGAAVTLTDLTTMTGGSWVDTGSLIVGTGAPGSAGLVRVPADGGAPSPILKLAPNEWFHTFPQLLPGRNAILMSAISAPVSLETSNIEIVSLDDGRRKTLVRGATSARYLESGHLMYASRAGMFAVPFDLERLEVVGAAVPVLADAAFDPLTHGAQFGVSRGGTLVYRKRSDVASTPMTLQWLGAGGKQEPLPLAPGMFVGPPRLSPDGRRVALAVRDGASQDIWLFDMDGGASLRLTRGGGTFLNPIWSLDGQFVVFGSMGTGLLWKRADGDGDPRALVSSKTFHFPTSLSRDGKLAFTQVDGRPQIYVVDLSAEGGELKAGTPTPFLQSPFTDTNAVFSPDGRWVAYQSDESGRAEVYVRPFPPNETGGRQQVSKDGGWMPMWLPNGRELLYQAGAQVVSVSYVSSPTFQVEKHTVWAGPLDIAAGFDVASNGKLAVLAPVVARDATRRGHTIAFVQNFLDELRRRVPVSR